MAHRRIVIDFDDDGEASGADGAGGGLLGSAHAAAADATGSSHGVLGTGSNKPADLLRSIQNMRMTLKRLEQQKQQHAAGATLAASAGSNSGGVLDKHITLQLQVGRPYHALLGKAIALRTLHVVVAGSCVMSVHACQTHFNWSPALTCLLAVDGAAATGD